MRIRVYSKHVDAKLKAAMHSMCGFALARLGISSRITKNLNLTIHMGHHSNEGEARVAKDANRYRPRDFKINLDHHRMEKDDYNRSLEDTEWGHRVLRTLAHELVHVKQYIRGELSWRDAGFFGKVLITILKIFYTTMNFLMRLKHMGVSMVFWLDFC